MCENSLRSKALKSYVAGSFGMRGIFQWFQVEKTNVVELHLEEGFSSGEGGGPRLKKKWKRNH
jgi:hypothetical protein